MCRWLWVGVGCWSLLACGGKLIDHSTQGVAGTASAGAPSASAGSGGDGQAGNGGSAGGQAGAAPACPDNDLVYCASWCGAGVSQPTLGECVNGAWRCPAPLIDAMSCPAESCVLQNVRCCDHVFGRLSSPDCGADGLFAACPIGFERNAAVCVADSAGTTACGTLEGESCSLKDAQCEAQGAHCTCTLTDGKLRWQCLYDIL